jgi:hypothetical protein
MEGLGGVFLIFVERVYFDARALSLPRRDTCSGQANRPSSSLHHSITPLLHHSITPSLHYSISPLLHFSTTPFLPNSLNSSTAKRIDMHE